MRPSWGASLRLSRRRVAIARSRRRHPRRCDQRWRRSKHNSRWCCGSTAFADDVAPRSVGLPRAMSGVEVKPTRAARCPAQASQELRRRMGVGCRYGRGAFALHGGDSAEKAAGRDKQEQRACSGYPDRQKYDRDGGEAAGNHKHRPCAEPEPSARDGLVLLDLPIRRLDPRLGRSGVGATSAAPAPDPAAAAAASERHADSPWQVGRRDGAAAAPSAPRPLQARLHARAVTSCCACASLAIWSRIVLSRRSAASRRARSATSSASRLSVKRRTHFGVSLSPTSRESFCHSPSARSPIQAERFAPCSDVQPHRKLLGGEHIEHHRDRACRAAWRRSASWRTLSDAIEWVDQNTTAHLD